MAHKKLGGWLLQDRLYVQLKIANELWTYDRKDGSGECATHLFFVGWYAVSGQEAKLLTINALWISLQVGVALHV